MCLVASLWLALALALVFGTDRAADHGVAKVIGVILLAATLFVLARHLRGRRPGRPPR